jgi:hypothetical protein
MPTMFMTRSDYSEHRERHLGGDLRQRLHQCVAPMRAFIVPNGVLDRFAPLAHGLRVRIETLLYGVDDDIEGYAASRAAE